MKLIIADSNEIVRIGLRTVLTSDPGIEIVGEATSAAGLTEMLRNFTTDIVIIDYTSPGFTIDIVPQILQKLPNINFVAITPEQSAQTLINALKGGVKSYVKKDCDSSEIILSVKETWRGNKFFCGTILKTIRDASIDVNDIDFEAFSCDPITLSERELEIIVLIAEGYTNNQIADDLCLSSHTINTHRKNIMGKLGVKNTAGIVMYAVKTNLVSPNKFLFASDSN